MNDRQGKTNIALRADKLALRLGSIQAVTDLSLDIRQGEFFAILGPSGSGKTTSLRLIAGLERPDSVPHEKSLSHCLHILGQYYECG